MKPGNFRGAIQQVKPYLKASVKEKMLSVRTAQKVERKGRPLTHAALDQRRNVYRNPEMH